MKSLSMALFIACLILSAKTVSSAQTVPSGQDQRLAIAIHLRDADAGEVLRQVCRIARLELDMPQDVKSMVTVNLDRPTLREALDAITEPAGLAYTIESGKLKVTRR